jgi:hypothetical protein
MCVYGAARESRAKSNTGGNSINYPGEVATLTTGMLVVKLLFNRVVSISGTRLTTIYISKVYVMTPLKHPKFIRINLRTYRTNHQRIQTQININNREINIYLL